jgi:hypothetical protein
MSTIILKSIKNLTSLAIEIHVVRLGKYRVLKNVNIVIIRLLFWEIKINFGT